MDWEFLHKPLADGKPEVHLVKDTTPQPTLTQYCKKTTFG